ncbi:acyl-CoA dehydrogenase family protein, partial [Fusobacterium sp. 1001295B_180824_G3]
MYNLKFSEEQDRIRQMVKEFAEKEVAPGAKERDLNEDFLATKD